MTDSGTHSGKAGLHLDVAALCKAVVQEVREPKGERNGKCRLHHDRRNRDNRIDWRGLLREEEKSRLVSLLALPWTYLLDLDGGQAPRFSVRRGR